MAFQLTPLHIPSLTTDFSAQTNATARLGEMLGNLPGEMQKQRLAQQKQQILGQIGTGNLDYDKGGRALIALGDTQAGATLLTLGQKQQQLDAQKGISGIFSGGASPAPLGSTAPVSGPASLIKNESGGNWQAQNNAVGSGGAVGHFGRLQFGQARIQDAINAGALPAGTTPQAFMASPELQKRAEAWHFADIDQKIRENGFDKLVGQSINGVPVTVDGLRAVAHLGGTEGMRKFVESGGRYNPADENGTRLSDYFARHGGAGTGRPTQVAQPPLGAPVQVAENEADVARLEAQMPGYGGAQPAQVAQATVAGDNVAKLRADAQYYAQSNPEAARQFNARADALERGNGGQVAQAPGSADLPPQGANAAPTQAQGFAVPGNALPPNDPYPRVTTQQLYGILQNPQASDGQRAMAKSIIDNRMKYSDENAPDKREMTRLQTEKLRREVEGEGGRPMTPDERKAYNVPDGQPAFVKRNGDPGFGPAGTRIDLNKGENKFEEELGKGQAKRFNDLIAEGDVAQGRLADIQTLRETSRRLGSQGSSANLKATVGPYAESLGIKVDGLSDIQLYESITQRLAPTLRAPGSGSTSDIEFKGFLRAIGPLSNTPAAREMILDTFEAASRNDIARADIASRLAQKEITRGQAEKEIRALPNPLESFREFRKQNPDLVGQAIKESAETDRVQRAAPPITTAEGYNALKPGDKYTDPQGNIRTKR